MWEKEMTCVQDTGNRYLEPHVPPVIGFHGMKSFLCEISSSGPLEQVKQ